MRERTQGWMGREMGSIWKELMEGKMFRIYIMKINKEKEIQIDSKIKSEPFNFHFYLFILFSCLLSQGLFG